MIENYFESIFQELFVSHAISSFKLLKREVGDEDGYIRVKCILSNGDVLELAEYFHIHKNKVQIDTYSYHWQTAAGKLVKRWDNVPHHKDVDTFPHHLHLSDGKVLKSSPMTFKKVLADIEKAIS